ncbi:MAG TPA: hypothetical protein VGG64_09420 [Pirellulales bacterium]|jgi:hypothetical protein
MGFFRSAYDRIRPIDSLLPFGFISLVVGIGFFVAGYAFPAKPNIKFEQTANYKVLEVREKISDLEILLKGQDILKTGETLSIVVLTISNDGRASIRPDDYDSHDPLGFDVDCDMVGSPTLVSASRKYLYNGVKEPALASSTAENKTSSSVAFNPVILDPGDSFTVKMLLLHPRESTPKVNPRGTIAGVGEIQLSDRSSESPSIWSEEYLSIKGGQLFWILVCIAIANFMFAPVLFVLQRVKYRNEPGERSLKRPRKRQKSLPTNTSSGSDARQ